MKNSFGHNITYTLFGESHGEAIGIVIDGLPAGLTIDMDALNLQMDKRRAKGRISTQRHEGDHVRFISGYFNNHTTGTPLTILIENQNTKSADYEKTKYRMRPGHADYTANEKYGGYQDYRGGGHFSGRLTAPITAAGAIAMQILKHQGIEIGSHILKCKGICDDPFNDQEDEIEKQIHSLNTTEFPVLNTQTKQDMIACIEEAANNGDSVGGILESAIIHMPVGIGEPFFTSIESTISSLLFSVPAVKGVEFGSGFAFADMFGSEANDAFYYDHGVKTKTNHNAGINGGISNGMPIIIKTVVKPTPSIYKEQDSVDMKTNKEVKLNIEGRHDPAIIHRARVVVDSMIAIGLLELLIQKHAISDIIK